MTQLVCEDEVISVLFLTCEVAENQPDDSHEVADIEDRNGQFEGFQTIAYFHEEFDIIVIDILILSQFWVVLNHSLQAAERYLLDFVHEQLHVENIIDFAHPYNFY